MRREHQRLIFLLLIFSSFSIEYGSGQLLDILQTGPTVSDPFRKALGIWGRLLNRMSDQSPPSDDQLHLKGAQENSGSSGKHDKHHHHHKGQEEAAGGGGMGGAGDIEWEDSPGGPPFGGGFGGGLGGGGGGKGGGGVAPPPIAPGAGGFGIEDAAAKKKEKKAIDASTPSTVKKALSPGDKIIDEQKLLQLLPRINSIETTTPTPSSTKPTTTEATTTTTSSPTTTTTTTKSMTTTVPIKTKKKGLGKKKRAKKQRRKKTIAKKTTVKTEASTPTPTTRITTSEKTKTTTTVPPTTLTMKTTSSAKTTTAATSKLPKTPQKETRKAPSKSMPLKGKGNAPDAILKVRMSSLNSEEFFALTNSSRKTYFLQKLENETAQLIDDIEKALREEDEPLLQHVETASKKLTSIVDNIAVKKDVTTNDKGLKKVEVKKESQQKNTDEAESSTNEQTETTSPDNEEDNDSDSEDVDEGDDDPDSDDDDSESDSEVSESTTPILSTSTTTPTTTTSIRTTTKTTTPKKTKAPKPTTTKATTTTTSTTTTTTTTSTTKTTLTTTKPTTPTTVESAENDDDDKNEESTTTDGYKVVKADKNGSDVDKKEKNGDSKKESEKEKQRKSSKKSGKNRKAQSDALTKTNATNSGIPEAEPEEEEKIMKTLQFDAVPEIGSASSTSAPPQNVFHLNANANANSTPNVTNMFAPMNAIVDGIGPLILPLIGYGRKALDAYTNFNSRTYQRAAEGVPTYTQEQLQQPGPPPEVPQVEAPRQFAAQTYQQMVTDENNEINATTKKHKKHRSKKKDPTTKTPERYIPDPPKPRTLEELTQSIGEHRHRNQHQQGGPVQEISGSEPPSNIEKSYVPPQVDKIVEPQPQIEQPQPPPQPAAPVDPGEPPNPKAGRRRVQDTFFEDSGVMMSGSQPPAPPSSPSFSPSGGGRANGFGGGRRPSGSLPFAFLR